MTGVVAALMGLARTGLVVRLNVPSAYGYRYGTGTVTTVETVIATATGGRPPYTYSWTRTSGSASISPTNPSSPNTKFSSLFGSSGSRSAEFRCSVLDADGDVALSATIPVNLESYG